MILLGGNKIIPVLSFDDNNINNGKVGEKCLEIQKWYYSEQKKFKVKDHIIIY